MLLLVRVRLLPRPFIGTHGINRDGGDSARLNSGAWTASQRGAWRLTRVSSAPVDLNNVPVDSAVVNGVVITRS